MLLCTTFLGGKISNVGLMFLICLHTNILFNMLHLCIQQNGNKHKLYNADKLIAYMYVSLAVHTNRSDTYSLRHAVHHYHPLPMQQMRQETNLKE